MAHKSPALQQLYGPLADDVYAQLETTDPELNTLIQTVAYDSFWLRPGLSLREKSITTVAAIVALRMQTPLRLHFKGFLSCCGTPEDLRNILIHLIPYTGFPAVLTAFGTLRDVLAEMPPTKEPPEEQ
jgi:4-carboxymuconolactone decarboxylase